MRKKTAWIYYLRSLAWLTANSNWWRLIALAAGMPARIRLHSLEFFVPCLLDYWLLKEVVVDDCYRARPRIAPGASVIDIGSSIGDFSIYAHSLGAEQIFAYECLQERVNYLHRNLALNNVCSVTVHKKKAVCLDTVFLENSLHICDVLKIDCEGGEYELLGSAQHSLQRVRHIIMEAHRFTPDMETQYHRLIRRLEALAFRVTEVPSPVHRTINYVFADRSQSVCPA